MFGDSKTDQESEVPGERLTEQEGRWIMYDSQNNIGKYLLHNKIIKRKDNNDGNNIMIYTVRVGCFIMYNIR